MSRYLVDQLAARPNIDVRFGAEVAAVHGDASLEAIDVRDRATGATDAARLRRPVHLHRRRRARPAGCRPRSRSTSAASCSPARTCAPPGAGRSTATRTCSRRACPGIFACGDVRFGPVKRVAAAVGEGSMAIAFVHQYLKDAGASLVG